eukprot:EG_transcript_48987
MGGCSSVAPLSPTTLTNACEDRRPTMPEDDDVDVDSPLTPNWGPQHTWYADSGCSKSGIGPRSVSCAVDSDQSPRKFLNAPTKPALQRGSILTFKLQRSREDCYAAPPRRSRPESIPPRPPRHPL